MALPINQDTLRRWLQTRLPLALAGLLAACTVVDTSGNQTIIQFYNPFGNLGLGPDVLRILYLVAGAVLLVFGWRIADYIVALAGFVIGAGIGLSVAPPGNEVVAIIALVAGGLIGAVLAVALQFVAIFLIGAYLGAVVTAQLWVAFSAVPVPTIALIIGAVIGGLLLLALSFQFIVFVSAAIGALLVGMALGLDALWIVALLVLGIIIQVILASATRTPIVYRRRVVRRRIRESDI
jgi:hypothetical protein